MSVVLLFRLFLCFLKDMFADENIRGCPVVFQCYLLLNTCMMTLTLPLTYYGSFAGDISLLTFLQVYCRVTTTVYSVI